MARCEVCGHDQYPANTIVRFDEASLRHFFCSRQHADEWTLSPKLPKELVVKEETTKDVIERLEVDVPDEGQALTEPPPLPERQKELDEAAAEGRPPAPKRRGRPPGTKSKPK